MISFLFSLALWFIASLFFLAGWKRFWDRLDAQRQGTAPPGPRTKP